MHNPNPELLVMMRYTLILLLFLLGTVPANAQVYKWTDKHGVVHYSDEKPAGQEAAAQVTVETVELTPIQILDSGRVTRRGAAADSTLAVWLDTLDAWGETARNTVASWLGQAPPKASANNSVEIYTTTWCGACRRARQWLQEHGVNYREYDVQEDPNAALRMRSLGGNGGVPFAVINGKTIMGFSPVQYQAALH